MKKRAELRMVRPVIPQPTPVQSRKHGDRIDRLGSWILSILIAAVLIGLAVDAFVRPARWLWGMP